VKGRTVKRDNKTDDRLSYTRLLEIGEQFASGDQRGAHVAWCDAELEADHWCALGFLTADQAALLLCGHNPHEHDVAYASDAHGKYTSPADFVRLVERLQAAEGDGTRRTLADWLAFADGAGLKVDPWAGLYFAAREAAQPEAAASMAASATTEAPRELPALPWIGDAVATESKAADIPCFIMPPMPSEVPAALLAQPTDAWVEYVHEGRRSGHHSGRTSARGLVDQFRDTIARQSDGWFTLEEAARMLEAAGCGDAEGPGGWIDKLCDAAKQGALPMHEPRTRERVRYARDNGDDRRVRMFWEWAHVGDLSRWLEANEPRLQFRFDAPAASDAAMLTATSSGRVIHSTQAGRSNVLTAVIAQAEQRAGGQAATAAQVFAELEHMARQAQPPVPLKGVTSGGVQYHDGGKVRTFTVGALRDRRRRARGNVR
jgi:hypothetical protein